MSYLRLLIERLYHLYIMPHFVLVPFIPFIVDINCRIHFKFFVEIAVIESFYRVNITLRPVLYRCIYSIVDMVRISISFLSCSIV